ncbi:MAG: DNA repair protein RecO [Oscillospiraceae bacterium]|jgi:DNA repair protein RecO (recombination protein O)|nr:DNA repair protein RecO [Oscillospiraceae bacterium]
MYLTTKSLILRSSVYKESSRVLTALTADAGKLTISARGALRKNSRIAASVQPLAFSEMTLVNTRERWTLTEAHIIEQFDELSRDLPRFALGIYFAELLEAVSDEDAQSTALLSLGLNALYALSLGARPVDVIKPAFETRLMCLSGYAPELASSSLSGSGFTRPVDADTFSALRYIVSCPAKKLYSFNLPSYTELTRVSEDYLISQLDRRFGALDYYNSVKDIKD